MVFCMLYSMDFCGMFFIVSLTQDSLDSAMRQVGDSRFACDCLKTLPREGSGFPKVFPCQILCKGVII